MIQANLIGQGRWRGEKGRLSHGFTKIPFAGKEATTYYYTLSVFSLFLSLSLVTWYKGAKNWRGTVVVGTPRSTIHLELYERVLWLY